VGGASPVGIEPARSMIRRGIEELVPYAKSAGVKVGLEPLHPMFAADRSVLTTIAEGLAIAQQYAPGEVGLILDVFHIWWDPCVVQQISASAGRIFGFHVSDWLVPLPDVLLGRGMMGDGVIDIRSLREAADRTGYAGPVEVEILNQAIWDQSPDSVLDRVVETFERFV
jgi:sugar phosphate isomerase/epimerase